MIDPEIKSKLALGIAAFSGVIVNLVITRPQRAIDWFATAICGLVVAWYGTHPAMAIAKLPADYSDIVAGVLAIAGHSIAKRIVTGAQDGTLPIFGKWIKSNDK